jgi:uncharacterized protein
MIRSKFLARIQKALSRAKIVAVVGPRQVGKTTLARHFVAASHRNYFDLEDPLSRARLDNAITELARLEGLVVIDEVQNAPELFPILRVLADRKTNNGQFLILGSASPRLLQQSSESLLGRIEVIEINGFSLEETGDLDRLWLRGGYPLAYLAEDINDSWEWRKQAVNRFVEQDLQQFGINVPAPAMLRFWMMLAHFHGQIWNAADPARSLGISESTVRRYLDYLTQTFMVRQLQPWFENIGKRQVKHPKIYFPDSGILHYLMSIRSEAELAVHPKSGASWEGLMLQQVLQTLRPEQSYFWATHNGAELDLLMLHEGRRIGVEFKRADAPKLSTSMRIAQETLRLDALFVLYPGALDYSLAEGIQVLPAMRYQEVLEPLSQR